MVTDHKNWWRRLMSGVRPGAAAGERDLPPVGKDGLLAEPVGGDVQEEAAEKEPGTLARWGKRDTAIARLQEGYEKANQLIADMQKHMAEQSQRTERMCTAIERLSRSMAEMPESASEQARTLQSILGQLQSSHAHSEQLAGVLESVPKAVKSQETALNGINRHMEMMAEQSVIESQTMEKLGGGLQRLGDQTSGHTRLLQDVVAQLTEQTQQFQQAMTSGTRRFTTLWIVTLVLALIGLVGVAWVLLRG